MQMLLITIDKCDLTTIEEHSFVSIAQLIFCCCSLFFFVVRTANSFQSYVSFLEMSVVQYVLL